MGAVGARSLITTVRTPGGRPRPASQRVPQDGLRGGDPHPEEDLLARGGRPGRTPDRDARTRGGDRRPGRGACRRGQPGTVQAGPSRHRLAGQAGWRGPLPAGALRGRHLRGAGRVDGPRAGPPGGGLPRRWRCPGDHGSRSPPCTGWSRRGAPSSPRRSCPTTTCGPSSLGKQTFTVNECICRLQQEQLGERCAYPDRGLPQLLRARARPPAGRPHPRPRRWRSWT